MTVEYFEFSWNLENLERECGPAQPDLFEIKMKLTQSLKLTQSYVDGCSTSPTSPTTEEDDLVMKEDDQRKKEDDRVDSDSSEEDKIDYMKIEVLLRSCKEVRDGNIPHSRLVPPPDQPKQEEGGHTILFDSACGADITTTVVTVT